MTQSMRTKAEKERAMEDAFVAEVKRQGCLAFKSETMGLVNHPDELILTPQRTFYWIEFKLDYNDLEPGQAVRFDQLRDKGHSVYTVRDIEIALTYHEYEMNRNG